MGCKASSSNGFGSTSSSFTLTMWDVKSLWSISCLPFPISFTLTMWDVKSEEEEEKKGGEEGFTLTMWDVKLLNLFESRD